MGYYEKAVFMKRNLVYLNYSSDNDTPAVETVPVLLPDEKYKSLTKGDEKPYFKIESIEYPAKGTGGIYAEEFFESFLNVTKDRPIPGTKRGHTWESRPASDFYTVGGRLDKNGDGSGTAHFRIYIPRDGDSDSNAGLIRDAQANIVHFSLVTYPEYKVEADEEGNEILFFTASKGYERNDAVEYGAGAMKQAVNSSYNFDIEEAAALIENGNYDILDNGNEVIRSGKVVRTALRRIVSRAPDGEPSIANLISMIDKAESAKKQGARMNKAELLEAIRRENGLTLDEIAKELNQADRFITDVHKNALSVVNELEKLGVKDPVAEIKANRERIEELAKSERSVALTEAFGASKVENGKELNLVREYAEERIPKNSVGEDLEKQIEGVKNSTICKRLAGEMADPNSEINTIETRENTLAAGENKLVEY
jgi:hypothetical protein